MESLPRFIGYVASERAQGRALFEAAGVPVSHPPVPGSLRYRQPKTFIPSSEFHFDLSMRFS